MDKKILVGSRAFFSQYEDFDPADKDYVMFHDEADVYYWMEKKDDEHIFHYLNSSKEQFIDFEVEHAGVIPMAANKLLVPELAEYCNITIQDLYMFNRYFERMDRKHLYALIIYKAYLENDSFTLTDEQRDAAYELYKSNR